MRKRVYAVSLAVMVVIGCSMMGKQKGPSLVGEWSGVIPSGSDITMIFKNNMTVDVSISGSTNVEFTGKYSVDYSADPITLDQFDFDDSEWGGIRILAIIKFLDKNKMLMCGAPDSESDRPTNFDYQALELIRE